MIDTCKEQYAEDIEIGDQLDLDGDEYGDNENAMFGYALVSAVEHFYSNKEPWVTVATSQGLFQFPAGHQIKVRVIE